LDIGLADRAIALVELEAGTPLVAPSRDTPVVAYVWAINLQKGDLVEVRVIYEGKEVAKNSERLERNEAQIFLFAGRRAPPGGWVEGTYAAEAWIVRDGKHVLPARRATVVK
jgi:hypothetical protein